MEELSNDATEQQSTSETKNPAEESVEGSVLDEAPLQDHTESIVLKKPRSLENIRYADPQGTIEYVFDRKEKWKRAATKFYKRLASAQKEASTQRKRAIRWKKRFEKESAMKQWWKFATFATGMGCFILVGIMICFTIISTGSRTLEPNESIRVPTSGLTQRTPNHVLASVIIFNGDLQGSGTIISVGNKYAALLTAAHNFSGKIGGKFWVYYVDGTYTQATLLAIDRKRDLALARVTANTIIAHAYVPKKLNDGKISNVGFTNGKGPIYKTLRYERQFRGKHNKYVWQLALKSGNYWDGDSGGGVFIGNALCGVATARNSNCRTRKVYASPHHEIIGFLNENEENLTGCGTWSKAPILPVRNGSTPPLWRPSPNVPIALPVSGRLATENPLGTKRPSEIPDDKLKKAPKP